MRVARRKKRPAGNGASVSSVEMVLTLKILSGGSRNLRFDTLKVGKQIARFTCVPATAWD
jgi:hypothetical protein